MLTLDGSSTHWELQLGWRAFVLAEKGKTSKKFHLVSIWDKDGKSPAGWNVKGVRKQTPSPVIAETVLKEHSRILKKQKKAKGVSAPNPVKDRKEGGKGGRNALRFHHLH